jgi:hypothetical protein
MVCIAACNLVVCIAAAIYFVLADANLVVVSVALLTSWIGQF